MEKQNKAYKFLLYSTEEQANLKRKIFGSLCFMYNIKPSLSEKELKKQKFPTLAKYKAE